MNIVPDPQYYVKSLTRLPQWITWRYQHVPGKEKPKKPPIDPKSGRAASPTDPTTWSTYAQAVAFAKSHDVAGIGLVLTAQLGITLVDLDDCFDSAGELLPWAAAIVEQLDSYVEHSPSGNGLHVLVYGTVAALKTSSVEIYSSERYATVTGRPYGSARPLRDAQAELTALRAEYATKEQSTRSHPTPVENSSSLVRTSILISKNVSVDASDDAVIDVLCRNAKQAARWAGSVSGNRSSHLFGLINGLVWLCGPDAERIERLVRQSGLYDAKRHDRNSGSGRSNLSVSVFNAIATWRGALYKWPGARITRENGCFQGRSALDPEPDPEPTEPTLADKLNALRSWLRYGGLSVMTRGRTHDTDLAVADALIDIAIERDRMDGLAIGLERLRSAAGLGSTSTARKALERLSWLVTKDDDGDRVTRSDVYSFNVGAVEHAVDLALAPNSPICRRSHVEKTTEKKIMRSATNGDLYAAHRSSDTFSTGGGGLGRTFGNETPGAGKLLLQLADIIRRDGLPMTSAQLAEVTGRRYRAVSNALTYGHSLGLLEREQESGSGLVRRFWYSVPDDIEQRIALAAVDMRTFGRGVDKAAGRVYGKEGDQSSSGAIGLKMHADRLLNLDQLGKWELDDAQRETLKAWSKLADMEYRGLCQIADIAATLDKAAIKEKIKASAASADVSRRAMCAAREFSRSILVSERQSSDPKDRPSPKQDVRLFRHWAGLVGYAELAGQDRSTQRLVELALKTVRHAPAQPAERKRTSWGDLQLSKRAEQAAAFEQRFGAQLPAKVAA